MWGSFKSALKSAANEIAVEARQRYDFFCIYMKPREETRLKIVERVNLERNQENEKVQETVTSNDEIKQGLEPSNQYKTPEKMHEDKIEIDENVEQEILRRIESNEQSEELDNLVFAYKKALVLDKKAINLNSKAENISEKQGKYAKLRLRLTEIDCETKVCKELEEQAKVVETNIDDAIIKLENSIKKSLENNRTVDDNHITKKVVIGVTNTINELAEKLSKSKDLNETAIYYYELLKHTFETISFSSLGILEALYEEQIKVLDVKIDSDLDKILSHQFSLHSLSFDSFGKTTLENLIQAIIRCIDEEHDIRNELRILNGAIIADNQQSVENALKEIHKHTMKTALEKFIGNRYLYLRTKSEAKINEIKDDLILLLFFHLSSSLLLKKKNNMDNEAGIDKVEGIDFQDQKTKSSDQNIGTELVNSIELAIAAEIFTTCIERNCRRDFLEVASKVFNLTDDQRRRVGLDGGKVINHSSQSFASLVNDFVSDDLN